MYRFLNQLSAAQQSIEDGRKKEGRKGGGKGGRGEGRGEGRKEEKERQIFILFFVPRQILCHCTFLIRKKTYTFVIHPLIFVLYHYLSYFLKNCFI